MTRATTILAALVASAALAAVPVRADDPAKTDTFPVLEGKRTAEYLVELKVRNVPKGTAVLWDVFPREKVVRRVVKAEQACLIAGPPGEYAVLVRLVKGEDVEEIEDKVTLTGGKVTPDPPNPGPQPDPKPDPGPVTPSKLRMVIVEETAEAVGGRGALLASKELATFVKEKGHSWRVVDKDVIGADGKPPADLAAFLKAAAAKPYPTLFLIDDKGADRTAGGIPAPVKAADLIATLKKYGG